MLNEVSISTDGGARGNPGPAACAIVIKDDVGNIVESKSKFLGETTNNVAEYSGLLMGLNWILENKNSKDFRINFYMDSELVIKQVRGEYKVKDENLKKLFSEVKDLQTKISSRIIFTHVVRSRNKEADALVNDELDRQMTPAKQKFS